MGEKWYFTFGIGSALGKHFITFHGTYVEARAKMVENFGTHWAFQYSEKEWKKDGISQQRLYNYTEIIPEGE